MKNISKRQQKRIDYFLKEKQNRKKKRESIHNQELPKYLERRIPVVRRLSRNIDQLLIVSSFVSPPLKPGLIDRMLVLAELEEVKPLICLNKSDLVEDPHEIMNAVKIYKDIGYMVLVTSAKTGFGIRELDDLVRNKRSALAGHSGVGKSSLLNALQPDLQIAEGEVSEWNNKGKHTTTQVTTYKLNENTEIYDLPGLKKLDFVDIHRDEARFYFLEFLDFAEECKFNDCLHLTEHNCAVKEAVENGQITRQRYKSYCNFVESL
jgi:ribosome biogenesis GTPase